MTRYRDPYSDRQQNVQFVQAALGPKDGYVEFVVTNDVVSMENHVIEKRNKQLKDGEYIVKIKAMTVKTFALEYSIPTRFAILSIDAEGIGDKVRFGLRSTCIPLTP